MPEKPRALLGLLKDILRRRAVAIELPTDAATPVSHCGCFLPEGCWGSGGWHNHLATLHTMDRRERIIFAQERPGWSVAELRKGYGEWWRDLDMAGQLDFEGVPAIWRPYLGQAMAYEPCPAYRAVMARNQESETARKAPGRKKYERGSWPKGVEHP